MSEDQLALELTPQSLLHFAARLKDGAANPLVVKLREDIHNCCTQKACLKYIIGSIAVIGKVDRHALGIIRGLCNNLLCNHLPNLSDMLITKNNRKTAIRFIARNIAYGQNLNEFGKWIKSLVEENWEALKMLFRDSLALLERPDTRIDLYCRILKEWPVEWQYEVISTGGVPLKTIRSLYSFRQVGPPLREMFALARYSYNPSPAIRTFIASEVPCLEKFLSDGPSTEANSCPAGMPLLNDDVWYGIFMFLDTETLTFVLPLVCTTWCRLYPKVLAHFTKIHDMYFHDFSYVGWTQICETAPWRYCLKSKAKAWSYFGHCIRNGTLDRAKYKTPTQNAVSEYWKAVAEGRAPLPKFRNCTLPYDSFLRLFEAIHKCYGDSISILYRPVFLTGEKYEEAVKWFVYKKRLVLALEESLAFDNLPKLFSIVQENEKLMGRLILKNCGSFAGAYISLVLYGQTGPVPEKLAKLVFSREKLFKEILEPESVLSTLHYDFVINSGILPVLLAELSYLSQLHKLVVSIILFLRNDQVAINKIAAQVRSQFSDHGERRPVSTAHSIARSCLGLMWRAGKYSPADTRFVEKVMVKFGLLDESES